MVLVYNLDVCDGLNNGAKGKVIDFIRNINKITHVIVEFANKEVGKSLWGNCLLTLVTRKANTSNY